MLENLLAYLATWMMGIIMLFICILGSNYHYIRHQAYQLAVCEASIDRDACGRNFRAKINKIGFLGKHEIVSIAHRHTRNYTMVTINIRFQFYPVFMEKNLFADKTLKLLATNIKQQIKVPTLWKRLY
ncbi:MAG: hypothetical protein AB8E15_04825 [Bdellovibrionales bacterium]